MTRDEALGRLLVPANVMHQIDAFNVMRDTLVLLDLYIERYGERTIDNFWADEEDDNG